MIKHEIKQEDRFCQKLNFVDENNVVLGYDYMEDCSEEFGWFIADTLVAEDVDTSEEYKLDFDISNYHFNAHFFATIQEQGDWGGTAVFQITDGVNKKYLHIFNYHNGYYAHGFEFTRGDWKIQEGSL